MIDGIGHGGIHCYRFNVAVVMSGCWAKLVMHRELKLARRTGANVSNEEGGQV